MKKLTEPTPQEVKNAWNGFVHIVVTDYEVEEADIGKSKFHYMGHARANYTFTKADVGRKVREDSSPGGCWYFLT
jgi:hypothetical protein